MINECQPSLLSWGEPSLRWIAEHLRFPLLNPLMIFVSEFGRSTLAILTIALSYWLWNKRISKFLIYGFFGSLFVNLWLKNWIKECRPPSELWMQPVDSYSFPSGHAQVATLIWWGFAYYTRSRALSVLFFLLGTMIALSRPYLGVHYIHDIAAGLIIGFMALIICILFEKKHWQPLSQLPLFVQAIILCTFFVSFLLLVPDPTDLSIKACASFLGFWLGCQWEATHLCFSPKRTFGATFTQMALGVAGIVFILKAIPFLLSPSLQAHIGIKLAQYALLGLWITYGAPYVFIKAKLVDSKRT